jgi:hypothetical protein
MVSACNTNRKSSMVCAPTVFDIKQEETNSDSLLHDIAGPSGIQHMSPSPSPDSDTEMPPPSPPPLPDTAMDYLSLSSQSSPSPELTYPSITDLLRSLLEERPGTDLNYLQPCLISNGYIYTNDLLVDNILVMVPRLVQLGIRVDDVCILLEYAKEVTDRYNM